MGHAWRVSVWCLGVLLLLLSVLTAFVGYVLPWGQMSFWGATVITSLASALPVVGNPLVSWLWGGLSVENATLNRFLSLISWWLPCHSNPYRMVSRVDPARACGCSHDAPHRSQLKHHLIRPRGWWRPGALYAPVLVFWPPRGLHPHLAWLWPHACSASTYFILSWVRMERRVSGPNLGLAPAHA